MNFDIFLIIDFTDISAAGGSMTPSSTPIPPIEAFDTDQQSHSLFRNQMEENLPLVDPFKDTGRFATVNM